MSRTILVTGSASGMGAATATRLAAHGNRVIGLDLRDADIIADLCTVEGRAHAVAETIRLSGGKLDGVVACAGLASAHAPDKMIGVNYFGTVAVLEGLRDALAASPAPRAAVIVSSASILPSDPEMIEACLAGDEARACELGNARPDLVYASTKRALGRWVRRTSIRPEWAGAGILLNCIAPGAIVTPMIEPILATEEGRAMMAQATPIAVAEYARADDVAPLLDYLSSEECRYMVGQVIFIDGGKDVIKRGEDVFGLPGSAASA